MIFSLYIFNRQGFNIHYQAFGRNRSSKMPLQEEFKLVFGLIYSIRGISQKLGPAFSAKENFTSYQTNTYKLTLLTVPSGTKFILLTDPNRSTENVTQALQELYSRTFYNYVVRHSKWMKIMKFTEEENGRRVETVGENIGEGVVEHLDASGNKIVNYKMVSYLNKTFAEETGKYMESLPFYS